MTSDDLACVQFVELVTDYLEDAMDTVDRARFEEHLADCPGCAEYLAQIRATRRVLGRVDLDGLSQPARGQLLDAFRAWRSASSGGAGC